jgi:hypothetical protein
VQIIRRKSHLYRQHGTRSSVGAIRTTGRGSVGDRRPRSRLSTDAHSRSTPSAAVPLAWLSYCPAIVGSEDLRKTSGVAESCPYSVRRVLTVSVRRAMSPAGSEVSLGRAVTSRTRTRAKERPDEEETGQGRPGNQSGGASWKRARARVSQRFRRIHFSSFPRLFLFHRTPPGSAPRVSSSSRRATGPAILSRQSSKPASCASSRVTTSSAMPLSITR